MAAALDWSHLLSVARLTALRICRSGSDADDVAQRVALAAQRQRVRPGLGWVILVARRQAWKLVLHQRRMRELETQWAASNLGGGLQMPRDFDSDVVTCLKELQSLERKAILAWARGHSHNEIAVMLHCHTRDVGTRLKRIIAKAYRITKRNEACAELAHRDTRVEQQ